MTATLTKILRRTLLFLLLLIATLATLGVIFISQLDLDDYRYELEQELSQALEQPVNIGRSKLAFRQGIALRFNDVTIGPQDTPLVEVSELTATLQIRPLFDGRIILDQVHINSPKLQLWLPIENRPERGTTHQLVDKLGISILTIRDAELTVHKRNATGSKELFTLRNMFTVLHGWQPGQTANLTVSGQLQQPDQPAEFLLDFNLPSSPDPETWRQEQLDYQLRLHNLALPFPTKQSETKNNLVDLNATVRGVPATGAQIFAELADSEGRTQHFKLSGNWHSSPEKEAISQLAGELLGLQLTGECFLVRQEKQHYLGGRFGATEVELTRELLKRWSVPDADNFLEGRLEQLALVVEKSWPADQELKGLPRIGAEVTITDFDWAHSNLRQIEDLTVVLSLENQQLRISDGILVSKQQPFFFSGEVNKLFTRPDLNLTIDAHTQLENLIAPEKLPENWRLAGPLPTTLKLQGPLKELSYQLRAELTDAELSLGSLLQKNSGETSSLQLSGLISREQLQLDILQLQLPALELTGNGCFDRDPGSDFFLLDIDPIDLAQLQSISPLLEKLKLQGTLHPTLERSEGGLTSCLQLNNVGAHLTRLVGDLSNTNGNINISSRSLSFEDLHADLGQSSFLLHGRIDSWKAPQLDLNLSSSHVRAHDLIFANRQLQLYDLAGALQVDANGIVFDQIKVRLEQETEAIVNGQLTDFSNPQVNLDISAEKANVDQVIALFIGPHKLPHTPRPNSKPVIINAQVTEGTIGDLKFQNASGLIKDHHHVFTIYPLHFDSGQGSCLARVEFDRNRLDGLLKVSGHAEGVDATILHQDLFKERGLINGSLRGDFYLEGSLAGEGFWPNASGAIHMQVKKGVLRKFRSLAKVFSLLNVSQLFAGKLPDMDKEGMPFSLLEATVRIAAGRAHTDDLKITSEAMNMSLVGSQSLLDGTLDYHMGVMPLRTVDKVISSIPVAGWVLAGDNKALLTAHFRIEGPNSSPTVTAVPINTVSDTMFGIVKRTFGLPGKLVKDIGSVFKGRPKKKEEPTD